MTDGHPTRRSTSVCEVDEPSVGCRLSTVGGEQHTGVHVAADRTAIEIVVEIQLHIGSGEVVACRDRQPARYRYSETTDQRAASPAGRMGGEVLVLGIHLVVGGGL